MVAELMNREGDNGAWLDLPMTHTNAAKLAAAREDADKIVLLNWLSAVTITRLNPIVTV